MNTSVLMGSSALFMAALGVTASFLPQEMLRYAGAEADAFVVLVAQVAGALYLGFAFLNWTARANLIGGIYSRPVALGNFLHFTVVTFALWKAVIAGQHTLVFTAGAVVYSAFAGAFGVVLFTHPGRPAQRGDAT